MKLPVFRKRAPRRIPVVPGVRAERRLMLTLWPYAGMLMLAVVCAMALVAWNAQQEQSQLQQGIWAELAERDARLAAARLERRLESVAAALAVLASEQRLEQAFLQGDPSLLNALQQQYQQSLPEAQRLALLPAGFNIPDMEAQPPIGYAVLDMLRHAERQQAAPAPEVHLPGQPGAHVNLVQPVPSGGEVVGHLIATYPVSWLQQAVQGLDGGLTLQQAGVSILQVGPTQGVQVRLPVPATNWQLLYVAPVGAAESGAADLRLPLVLLGLLLLLIAMVFWFLQREVSKKTLAAASGASAPQLAPRRPARPQPKPSASRAESSAEHPGSAAAGPN